MASIEPRTAAAGKTTHRVVWRLDGEKQSATFPAAADARRAKAIAEGEGHRIDAEAVYRRVYGLPDPEPVVAGVPTLDAWAVDWFTTKAGVSPGTLHRYRRQYALWITDWAPAGRRFGDTPLDEITPGLIRAWVVYLAGVRAPATVARYHALLHQLLRDAAAERHIPINPAAGTRLPRAQDTPDADTEDDDADVAEEGVQALTRDEVDLLLGSLRSPDARDLVLTLVGTGVRWSEATALRTRDTDLLAQVPIVRVRRAWKRGIGSHWYVGPPKSRRSKRTVSLPAELVTVLAGRVDLTDPDALLFPGRLRKTKKGAQPKAKDAKTRRLDHSNWMRDHWYPAVARAQGVDPETGAVYDELAGRELPLLTSSPTPHTLRHTHASWLIAANRPLPEIQRRIGHESITTTIDTYGHMMPESDDETAKAISEALGKRGGG